ncbi:MAG: hypothetical protein LBI05_02710 [Planctomycetaceae bacterium]|jgi:hypothetical protein|nr:hypothetical protein [Planctomycetaceae bacterium]
MLQTAVSQWNKTAFENSSERISLLYHDELSGEESWEALEDLRDDVLGSGGQYISLDLSELQAESLPEMFYTALKNSSWERSLQMSLPIILRHNPRAPSQFINRAIHWQRLCDMLIMDEEPDRETVLVLENVDQASPATQHEIARLIRFHESYSIRRTFVFTLDHYSHDQIIPELRNIFAMQ